MNLTAGILAIGVAAAAAGCAIDVRSTCAAAGETYTEGTRVRSSPGQQAAEQACETSGGVYVGGEDTCEFGMGGP